MSRSPRAVAALRRWRAFGEAQARDGLRQQQDQLQQAADASDAAQRRHAEIADARLQLLQPGTLDFVRLQIAAQLDAVALEDSETRRQQCEAAERDRDQARDEYVSARAATKVADARRRRLAEAAAEQREKQQFDWMADLLVGTRTRT